jgi:predicted amidohydrolase
MITLVAYAQGLSGKKVRPHRRIAGRVDTSTVYVGKHITDTGNAPWMFSIEEPCRLQAAGRRRIAGGRGSQCSEGHAIHG